MIIEKIKEKITKKQISFSLIKIIFLLFSIISIAIIYYKMNPLFSCASVISEDFFMPYNTLADVDSDGVLQIFTSNDHSWFILSMFHVLSFRYLPLILNLHPQMCAQNVMPWFTFFIFILLLAVLAENLFKYSKNKLLPSIGLILIFPYLVLCIQKSEFLWAFHNTIWLYAYFLLPMFPLLLINEFEYYFVTSEKINKKNMYILAFLFVCTAVSHEFFRFVEIISLFLGFWFYKFIFKPNIDKKKYFCIFGIIVFFNTFLCFTPQFQALADERCTPSYLNEFLTFLFQYLKGYINFVITNNLSLFIVYFISLLIILFFVKNKEEKIKFCIYNLSLLVSGLIFMFVMMIFVNNYNNMFILEHSGLKFLFALLLLNLTCSAVGFVFKYVSIKRNIILPFFIICNVFFVLFLFFNEENFDFKWELNFTNNYRKNAYILEKVYLLNRKKNNKIYNYYTDVYENRSDYCGIETYLVNTYKTGMLPEQYKQEFVCTNLDDDITCRNKMLYLAKKKLGYEFSTEELQHLDFGKLYVLQ